MYTIEDLFQKLQKNNLSVSKDLIFECLHKWHIDAVYEDEAKSEYFDDIAVIKLNQGLKLKEQGIDDKEIISIIGNNVYKAVNAPAVRQTAVQTQEGYGGNGLKRITVDITTQTLALLADSIANKISNEIASKIKDSDVLKPVIDNAKITRDNEILSGHVKKLLDENKKLITRNNFLLQENSKFKHIAGSFYMKQP
jgi:hypothetical protein